MNIIIPLDKDDVIMALCWATLDDPDLIESHVSKAEIKKLCQGVVEAYGLPDELWSTDLHEEKATEINGWACAQAGRYSW